MAVDQQRVGDVLGDEDGLLERHLLGLADQVDAAAARRRHRLDDPRPVQPVVRRPKVAVLARHQEARRQKVETPRPVAVLQPAHVLVDPILARHLIAPKEFVQTIRVIYENELNQLITLNYTVRS